VRLVELALWETPPVPRCHAPLLLCALLLREQAALLATPPALLAGAIGDVRIASVLAAERLHAAAVRLASTTPSSLRSALDAAWCAAKLSAPPFACAWMEPAELGRTWVVDLRPLDAFEASHFALTSHLPPELARMSDARQAMRAELFDVCNEGAFGLTFVTTSDPLAEKRGDPLALSSDEVRLLVHEFVRAGFRHVGVLRGGFAALSPEQLAELVSSSVSPFSDKGAAGTGKQAATAALDAVGRIGANLKERIPSFGRRRAKPSPL